MLKQQEMPVGKNVYLSIPKLDDQINFLAAVAKSHNFHYPWVFPPNDEEDYFKYINRLENDFQFSFFVRLNTSSEIVGVINLNEIVRGCFQSAYLGFYVFADFQSQGLMSEGLSLVIAYAFNQLGLHRLEANIQADNVKSVAFIKNHNFRHEGVSPNYLKINEKWQDHERFAITVEDIK